MKKTQQTHPELKSYLTFLDQFSVILDIKTSGRYWRTSSILEIDLLYVKSNEITESVLTLEKEEDEYDMLVALSEVLTSFQTVITFNGNSFDLPHLKHKYKAYGLTDPLPGKTFRDLFSEYREYASFLALPSRKLADYADYLNAPKGLSDVAQTLVILSLDALTSFFNGNWDIVSAHEEDGYLYYTLHVSVPFLKKLSLHDQVYHIMLEEHTAKLSAKITDGRLRRYYTDYKDYYYLPLEGYAIHKSMASFVEKSHKEKAVRENCFSLVTYSNRFLTDSKLMHSYISSVLLYLHSR